MNDKTETTAAQMNPPSGLDLNPQPPRSVRVSKRAAGALMAIAAVILGLFAYGGYKRQQRQVATLAGEVSRVTWLLQQPPAPRSQKRYRPEAFPILRNNGLARQIRERCSRRVTCNLRKQTRFRTEVRFMFDRLHRRRNLCQPKCPHVPNRRLRSVV